MSDSFTEVTREGYFSKLGGAIKGVLFGFILFLVSFVILFWNEGRAVKRYQALKEGSGIVVSVDAHEIDAANKGKLVHVTGTVTLDKELKDSQFGIQMKALRLKRKVEMYQWEEKVKTEKEKKVGGSTETVKTYSYHKTWSSSHENSNNFKERSGHENPSSMPYKNESWNAGDAMLGAYKFDGSLVRQVAGFKTMNLNSDLKIPSEFKLDGNKLYKGSNPSSPQVGDVRVSFEIVEPGDVSVIAAQTTSGFEPYQTQAGGTLHILKKGIHSSKAMFEQEQSSNATMTWILRVVGILVMFFGISLILNPLAVLGDVIPFIGNILETGVGIISFLVALVLSFITIAIAWLFYRPLLAIILIAAGGALVFVIKTKLSKTGKVKLT